MPDFFDIKTDDRFTYAMRIALGKLLADENRSDVSKFLGVFDTLYGYKPKARDYAKLLPKFEQILGGLSYWLEAEATMLASTPTADEIAAGGKEYADKVGEMGTVVQLAKDFGKFPNDVLARPYSEIFTVLFVDHERGKFEKRLNDVMTRKFKH